MNASKANLINSAVLIIIGLLGYFATNAPTAFILVGFGAALLACSGGVTKENKVIAHIAVVLTLVTLLALLGQVLPKAIDSGETPKLIRAIVPIITGVLSMVFFIKSFRDARIARENAAK